MNQTVQTADEFFSRVRTDEEMRSALLELPENRLQLAMKEARESPFARETRVRRARRATMGTQDGDLSPNLVRNAHARRVAVSTSALKALPHTRLHAKTGKADRMAARFWERAAHIDVAAERDGYDRYVRDLRMATFKNAPIDPISAEEYGVRMPGRKSAQRRQLEKVAKGRVISPVGEMTLDDAYRIARRALGIEDD